MGIHLRSGAGCGLRRDGLKREGLLLNAFDGLNPFVLLAYYGAIMVASATMMHPAMLLCSLLGSVLTAACRMGLIPALKRMLRLLPLALLTAAINPLFNHEGATILRYLPGGNPLTLESLYYGAAAGAMLLGSLNWFLSISSSLTGEKWMYLLGRAAPALSLVLSMIFRFVPRLIRQTKQINDALALSERSQSRLRRAFRCFSGVISWALEDAAETADSMRCRGYGLPGRTAFARYGFDLRDAAVLAATALLSAGVFGFAPECLYFPVYRAERAQIGAACMAVLAALPAFLGAATQLRYISRLRRTAQNESAGNQ